MQQKHGETLEVVESDALNFVCFAFQRHGRWTGHGKIRIATIRRRCSEEYRDKIATSFCIFTVEMTPGIGHLNSQ